jgi:hypothetical protein
MGVGEKIGYEVHVTCDTDPATFISACEKMGVRPVHAHNIVGSAVVSTELLTQADGFGTKDEALAAMYSVAQSCRAAGLTVIREKVEVDPTHSDAPYEEHAPGIDYLEAHIRIVHPPGQRSSVLALRDELQDHGLTLWASYNTLKRLSKDTEVTMLTARSFTQGLPEFVSLAELAQEYAAKRFEVRPLITEWAIADNNTDLDNVWITPTSRSTALTAS